MHYYKLFGLTVESELDLPELAPASVVEQVDVTIRTGEAPRLPDEHINGLTVSPNGAIVAISEVGRFWVAGGRSITIEPSEASERNIRLYLLGSVFAAVLHQRGLLPLHANAVVIDGMAVAFAGHPGAGKSTLAAWFHDNGFDILADDVCVVRPGPGSRPLAEPGLPRLRLWREALDATGRSAEGLERSFDDMDKYNVPIADSRAVSTPLSHIYLLRRSEAALDEPRIRRLRGIEAVEAIVENTYRGAYIAAMGATQRHLAQCLDLVGRVPVFSVERSFSFDRIGADTRYVQRHAQGLVRGDPSVTAE